MLQLSYVNERLLTSKRSDVCRRKWKWAPTLKGRIFLNECCSMEYGNLLRSNSTTILPRTESTPSLSSLELYGVYYNIQSLRDRRIIDSCVKQKYRQRSVLPGNLFPDYGAMPRWMPASSSFMSPYEKTPGLSRGLLGRVAKATFDFDIVSDRSIPSLFKTPAKHFS